MTRFEPTTPNPAGRGRATHRVADGWRGARALARMTRITATHVAGQHLDPPGVRARPDYGAWKAQRWARELLGALDLRLDVRGAAPEGPALYVANHRSYLDIVALLEAVRASFVAKAELRRWPLLGPAAALGGTLFVDRADRADRRRTRACIAQALGAGRSIVVFPEGTTHARGLGDFRPGAFEVAAHAGVPVVPVALEYADPRCAWVGDDGFASHFTRTLGRGPIHLGLDVGAPLPSHQPGLTRAAAHAFIAARLGPIRARLTPAVFEAAPESTINPKVAA